MTRIHPSPTMHPRTRKLWLFATDGWCHRIPHKGRWSWLWKLANPLGELIDKLMPIFCIRGHRPIDDQCNIPAHQYCYVCNSHSPNALEE